jgi:hypothetical protein
MNRIISILSLVFIVGGLGYSYYTGLLMQFVNPSVQVLSVNQDMLKDQRIRPANLEVLKLSISDISAGTLVFPEGIAREEILASLKDYIVVQQIPNGSIVSVSDISQIEGAYMMRVIGDVAKGEMLDSSNTMVNLEVGEPPDGAIIFSNENSAFEKYIDSQVLSASRDIPDGDIVMVDNVSGGTGSIYVLSSAGSFSGGSLLTLQDLDIVERPTRDIPRGAVSFPSRVAAEMFVSTSGGILISRGIDQNEILAVSSITSTGGSSLVDGEVPNTLEDYLEYKAKFPGQTLIIDDQILVGSEAIEGMLIDLWVEMERTDGPFGVVKIKKIVDNVMTFRVTNVRRAENGVETEFFHWAEVGLKANTAIEEARAEARMAFMVGDSTSITDFIGNGSVCRGDVCSVSRNISNDLNSVRMAFSVDGQLVEESPESQNDPFRIIDGVDSALESRMISGGYSSFRDIAEWEDKALKVIAFNLGISSQNLASYIRQQARNIVTNPEKSRQDLGLTNRSIDQD